jgi:hypothetical protein
MYSRLQLTTSKLHLPKLIGTASHPDMQKIWIIEFFFEIGSTGNVKWKKISTNGYFKLHIYLLKNKTLIHNYIKLVQLYNTILNMYSSPINIYTITIPVNGSCQRPLEACAKQKHWGGRG